ncbi:cofilin [Blastocladiella emersonii ATCC 22665]|nr:cofilin [Blastocladiella emersonii ATCC 22665]
MSTGIAVADNCIDVFTDLKLGKKLAYIVYKLNDSMTEIVVEKTAPAGTAYDAFLADLPAADCRYAVFDFEFEHPEGGIRNKIIFVSWAPDEARVRSKMVYAGSRDALRRKLVGIHAEIQGTDLSEVDQASVLEKVNRV